jgi:hypothetical protein
MRPSQPGLAVSLKHLLFFSLFFYLQACQKESSLETSPPPSPPTALADTLVSVVVDGDYGGYFLLGYDSAVLNYRTNGVQIQHYNRNKMIIATETILYDNANRVLHYAVSEPSNTYKETRHFQYLESDLTPSAIKDTLVEGGGTQIGHLQLKERSTAGSNRKYTFNHAFFYTDPAFNHNVDLSGTFDKDWRLLGREIPGFSASRYHYNTSGDMDSCFSSTLSGDNTYAAMQYTTAPNPLYELSKVIFKNLTHYTVVDNLSSTHYEDLLDVCYFPSELLTSRIPLKSRFGLTPTEIETENTFTYQIDNSELKGIIINHRDLNLGGTSQTHIRLYKQ